MMVIQHCTHSSWEECHVSAYWSEWHTMSRKIYWGTKSSNQWISESFSNDEKSQETPTGVYFTPLHHLVLSKDTVQQNWWNGSTILHLAHQLDLIKVVSHFPAQSIIFHSHPFTLASHFNKERLPVDGQGRAYVSSYHETFHTLLCL